MKRILSLILIAAFMAVSPTFTGCVTNQTTEAKVFYSFKTTYNIALKAYEGFAAQVVLGKVPKPKEQQVDKAWNQFRAAFQIAFQAASMNWNAATPEAVQKLADDLNRLILSL